MFQAKNLEVAKEYNVLFQVIPAEEHAAKIACARDAIGDSDFFLVARTESLMHRPHQQNMVFRMPFCGLIFTWRYLLCTVYVSSFLWYFFWRFIPWQFRLFSSFDAENVSASA
ncbi:Uncharacterized protein Adt_19274 [Abeliophyllum distichum]|uniref:Uncharacterized protein n=1 Tax=Abeliophyllum distichum TaxID=126358 RepID=A0ABD1STJ6_9LAMI